MNDVWNWLVDPVHWSGASGIPTRLVQHLGYTGLALLVALVIGVPLGLIIGHTGKGGFAVVSLANSLRALPTLGLLVLLVLGIGIGLGAPLIALVVLAVPPILAGSYAGVRAVDPAVTDAARGVGMRGSDVLVRVELPNALPLIVGGVRSATLQVVSTATIAAFVALGGLGRLIIDGLAQRDYPQMAAGSVLVALLAIVADLALAGLQRLLVSPGLRSVARVRPSVVRPAVT